MCRASPEAGRGGHRQLAAEQTVLRGVPTYPSLSDRRTERLVTVARGGDGVWLVTVLAVMTTLVVVMLAVMV